MHRAEWQLPNAKNIESKLRKAQNPGAINGSCVCRQFVPNHEGNGRKRTPLCQVEKLSVTTGTHQKHRHDVRCENPLPRAAVFRRLVQKLGLAHACGMMMMLMMAIQITRYCEP